MNQTMLIIVLVLQLLVILLVGFVLINIKRNAHEQNLLKYDVQDLEKTVKEMNDEFNASLKEYRLEFSSQLQENRVEIFNTLNQFSMSIQRNLQEVNQTHASKFDRMNVTMITSMDNVKNQVEKQLTSLQQDNNTKLEQMRMTVDEKLQASVEKRFNESFKLISERLDMVQQGLGEMQHLATGVGDLKKVLTNVKTRGNLGEIQLKNILEEVLTPQQYIENAKVNATNDRVEFAITLPGVSDDGHPLLLPIDSKFPIEDYQRLLEAYDSNEAVDVSIKAFENSVRKNAKTIHNKYINPPLTTDFAIMFVPTEGLYAEILRVNGLFESLQRDLKITVVGPSNLVAFLSSLQMGFKTLAIEKRSSEVWQLLGSIKNEFHQFGGILDKTKRKLQEATNVIEQANTRTRVIQRKLRNVETLDGPSLFAEIELYDDEESE